MSSTAVFNKQLLPHSLSDFYIVSPVLVQSDQISLRLVYNFFLNRYKPFYVEKRFKNEKPKERVLENRGVNRREIAEELNISFMIRV